MQRNVGSGPGLILALCAALASGCDDGIAVGSAGTQAQPHEEPASGVPESERFRYRLDLADVHLRYGNLDEALAGYEAVEREAADPALAIRASYGRALVSLRRGDRAAAIGPLERVMAGLDPGGRIEIGLVVAALRSELGEPEAALTTLDALSAEPVFDPELARRLEDLRIEVHRRQGSLEALASRLEVRLRADPGNRETLAFLTRVYGDHLGDVGRAFQFLGEITAASPRDEALQSVLADAGLAAGDLEAARRALEAAIELADVSPARAGYRLRLAEVLQRVEAWDRAIEVLEAAESDVEDSAARREVRLLALRTRKAAGGLEARRLELERRVEAGETPVEALRELVLLTRRVEGDLVAAEGFAARLLEVAPADPEALADAAEIARDRSDRRGMVALVDRLLKADPARATGLLDTYADALIGLDRLDRAVEVLLDFAARDPANRVAALDRAARVLERSGQPEEAARVRAQLVAGALGSRDPAAAIRAVVALRSSGRPDEAGRVAREALGWPLDAQARGAFLLQSIEILAECGEFPEAERLCGEVAGRPDVPEPARRRAQRRLLDFYQSRGRPVVLESR